METISGPNARQVNKYVMLLCAMSLLLTFLLTMREPLFVWGRDTRPTSGGMLSASSTSLAILSGILVYLLGWAELIQDWARRRSAVNWAMTALLLLLNVLGVLVLWVYDGRLVEKTPNTHAGTPGT